MTAKEYLRQLWQLDKEIEIKCMELKQLRASIGIRAMPDPEQNIGHSGNISDPVSDITIRITRMEECLKSKINKLYDLRETITEQIDGMECRNYRNILTCRYVLMQSWEDVAESMKYDKHHCYKIHGRALQEFYRLYLKDTTK